jgi:S-layer homology domain
MHLSRWSIAGVTSLTTVFAAGAIAPFLIALNSPVTIAQTNGTQTGVAQTNNELFPDIQNHWARPFIRVLANEGIVRGYLDGTYRPEASVKRDEFAALVNQAFDREQVRQIESGSVYQDIPEGYWASDAIEAAYEQGFVNSPPSGPFNPDQPLSKAEVLSSLARNLNLPRTTNTAQAEPTQPSPIEQNSAQTTVQQPSAQPARSQSVGRRTAKKPILFPLAMTALMQPVLQSPVQATRVSGGAGGAASVTPNPSASAASPEPTATQPQTTPTAGIISNYYVDANQIPTSFTDDVAAATTAGIVVNYPELKVLNPNQAITRGEIAALIHQALVYQNRLAPLPEGEAASNYVVDR